MALALAYLIDSDWTAEYLKGRPTATALVGGLAPDGIAISIVTDAEIYEGIYYGRSPAAHEAALWAFLQFAKVRGDLRRQGLLIPQADLFIAATALYHDLTLVTRNKRHFDRIPGLKLHP